MRLFLAIDLPDKTKESLFVQLQAFRNKYPDFTWVPPENYHVTLGFFGDMFRLDEAFKEKIERCVYDISPLYFYSRDVDLFQTPKKITIHVGFRRDKNLEKIVERMKEAFSLYEDKKFIPHLTIARYRLPSKQQYFVIKKRLHDLQIDVDFKASKLHLFDSILNRGKPLYKKMLTFPLTSSD